MMTGIGTIIGKWTLGQLLLEFKRKSSDSLTKSLEFRKFCQDLNIPLGLEDDVKVLYIQTLIQLADLSEEYKEWTELFILKSVLEAFIDSQNNSKKEIFARELDAQLHKNQHINNLKKFNTIPNNLLKDFYATYSSLINNLETPTQKKASLERKEIIDEVKQLTGDKSNNEVRIPIAEIIQEFTSASFILAEEPNTFNDLPNSHIERNETTDLINWIEKDQEQIGERNPIALLVGNAGTGKTTILKDLLVKLQDDKVPVLGIKADRFYVASRKKLEEKLNIEHKLIGSFENIIEEKGKLVVIIDQIDALSQSLSARREYLDTINQLVRDASDLSGIRIIISIRTFDLAYDDDFRFYKNQKELKVTNLSKLQVEDVLKKIEFPLSQLSESLFDLIKIPLHLNVFCKVYAKGRSYQNVKTLNDLYVELWQEKIVKIIDDSRTNPKRCKKLLFKLSKHMNDGQWITLNSARYKDDFSNELNYLQSVGLVSLKKDEIQFFHQTFYDFCFAKRFVEKNKSLTVFIKEKKQSLFVRSAVKMILDFQRSYDIDAYIENYRKIFTKEEYRFHIKLLLINLLGFVENPNEKEKSFVSEILLKKDETCYVFLESALSSGWFIFLQEETDVFSDIFNINGNSDSFEIAITDQKLEINDFWYQFFRKHIVFNREQIIAILCQQPESEHKDNLTANCLFILDIWDIPQAYELFEKCLSKGLIDDYTLYKIIESISSYNFDYSVKIYIDFLRKKSIEEENRSNKSDSSAIKSLLKRFKGMPKFSYNDENLLEKMREANPVKFVEFGVSQCLSYLKSKNKDYYQELYPDYGCINDLVFDDFYFDEIEENCNNHKMLFKETALAIKSLSKEGNVVFLNFIKDNISSKYISILKLLIYGFVENPNLYSEDIITLIRNLDNKNGFLVDNNFYLYVRELIKASFKYLSPTQKQFIVDFICSFELNYKKQIAGKRSVEHKRWCLKDLEKQKFRFIKVIKSTELKHFPILRKTLLELERKYPTLPRENRGGIHLSGVSAPVKFESCKHFTFKDWKRSFSRYSSNEDRNWDKGLGGLSDHARQFYNVVSNDPTKFVPFIHELIEDGKIAHEYLIQAMEGLKDGNCEITSYETLFLKLSQFKLNAYQQESIIRLTDYFIQKKHINSKILKFLIDKALDIQQRIEHHKGEDIVCNGLGSVRGAAVYRLTCLNFESKFKEKIFGTLNKVAIEGNEVLLTSLLSSLSNLRMLDKKETLHTFLAATNNLTLDITKSALNCFYYLYYDFFENLYEFIEKAIEFEDVLSELSKYVGFAWITNRKGAGRFLVRILEKSTKAKAMMVYIAEENMWDTDKCISKRSQELFERYINIPEQEIVSNYSSAFIRFDTEYFEVLVSFMNKYALSNAVNKESGAFIKYLSKCSKKHPYECIDLVSNFSNYEFKRGTFHRVSPISVVVGAINSLNQITVKTKRDNEYIEKGISLFDSMLKDSRLRNFAESALLEIN